MVEWRYTRYQRAAPHSCQFTVVSRNHHPKSPPGMHWIWNGGLHVKPLRSDYSHDAYQYRMSPHRYHLFVYLPNDPFQQNIYRPNVLSSVNSCAHAAAKRKPWLFDGPLTANRRCLKPNINERHRYFWWQGYIRNLFSVWNMACCIAASISRKSTRCIHTAQKGVVQELRKYVAATAQTWFIQQRH